MTGPRKQERFEAELRHAAIEVAGPALSHDLLEVPLPRALERERVAHISGRAWAAGLAAVLVVAIGIGVAVGALRTAPPPGEPRPFRSTTAIAATLQAAGWGCRAATGQPGSGAPSSAVSRPSALTCDLPPTQHPLVASLTVDEETPGVPSGITVRADVLGTPAGGSTTRLADLLYLAIGLPFERPEDAAAARSWLRSQPSPQVARGSATAIAGVRVRETTTTDDGIVIEIGRVAAPN